MVAERLVHGLALQLDWLFQADVGRRCTYLDLVCAWSDIPLATAALTAVAAELVDKEACGHCLSLAWL